MMDGSELNCLLGFLGGLSIEVLAMYRIAHVPGRLRVPATIKTKFYWATVFAMSLAGSLIVYLYTSDGAVITHLLAFHIGISAPLILGNMSKHAAPHVQD